MNDATPDRVRGEVAAWLRATWDPQRPLVEWRSLLVDSGWAAPSWPTQWFGRGLPAWADAVVADAIREAGAVGPPLGSGTWLAAPTILAHGSDAVKARLLRPVLTGEETWCQLFSEPGAGSDLAGLTTTAVADGDTWVVNGQKVWNTSADHADFGMLVARTDWDVPKHRGITYFALPMHQPGVEARPLRQMNGYASFNEVFLTDAHVPNELVVGDVADGWRVALTTLAHERRFATLRRERPAEPRAGRTHAEAEAEAEAYFATYVWYPQRAGRPDLLIDRAQATGTGGDPLVREQIAAVHALARSGQWTAQRAQAARALGREPGPEGSIGKLAASAVARAAAAAHSLIGGADGLLAPPDAPAGGVVAEVLVSVPGQSIAGGTDEIQRNILGERALGLPREPAPDRDLPFRQVLRNA